MTLLIDVADAVAAALDAVDGLTVFVGGIPDDAEIPRTPMSDGRPGPVKSYVTVFMGAGQATSDRHAGLRRISDTTHLDLALPFQVTAAAGTHNGALWAVERARGALTGLRLLDGATRLREITQPGNVREDKTVPNDVRWYLPMQYRFTTTT